MSLTVDYSRHEKEAETWRKIIIQNETKREKRVEKLEQRVHGLWNNIKHFIASVRDTKWVRRNIWEHDDKNFILIDEKYQTSESRIIVTWKEDEHQKKASPRHTTVTLLTLKDGKIIWKTAREIKHITYKEKIHKNYICYLIRNNEGQKKHAMRKFQNHKRMHLLGTYKNPKHIFMNF